MPDFALVQLGQNEDGAKFDTELIVLCHGAKQAGEPMTTGWIMIAGHYTYWAAKRFRTEKWWERKANAYSDLISVLRKAKWHIETLESCLIDGTELSREDRVKLTDEYNTAHARLTRIRQARKNGNVSKARHRRNSVQQFTRTALSFEEAALDIF